jgi:large subunit ribosomal protein L18
MRNTEIASTIRKRDKRKFHIRKSIAGSAIRPRMSVYKSNKYLYVQVVDDDKGCTLASVSTLEEGLKGVKKGIEGGTRIGEEIGNRLKTINIAQVVFDRNGYLYHGIVKAIADGARKAGIQF